MSEAPDPEVVELATKIFDLARQGETEQLVAYVDAGVPANLTNDRGQTPLAGAVFKGETDVVKALLEGGADPAAGTPSAVDTARMFARTELLELFGES